eukprot:TRINITY_DN134_c0_g1_i1.p1 TRINITY_DN134_c0_g1~~TRINITY_DN134_c0_g1_i1.p1  ORF type:complete len:195 (+),score=68.33 TRINITY_DN134_c0_g1_i1:73-585(+)
MPNKIPRACAIAQWSWTYPDHGYTQNKIVFEDKAAINAQCLTMHTFCSDSDYEYEAIHEQIKACDDKNIVKDGNTPNHLIYTNYIHHLSDDHHKLYEIMQNDHQIPDFYPPRAFADHPHTFTTSPLFIVVLAIVGFAALYCACSWYSKRKQVPSSSLNDEYKPLLGWIYN